MAEKRTNIIKPSSYQDRVGISAQQELDVLREFVVDLMGLTSVGDLCWYVAKEVVGRLGFVDCVIYLFEPNENDLIQAAAMGAGKNPEDHQILNQPRIPLGKGITGTVAQNRQAEIVLDAHNDPRFIHDVMEAQSEICVPLIHEGKLLGVIDCEDPRKEAFNDRHLTTLTAIASITSSHWVQCQMIDKMRSMQSALEDALQESQFSQRAQSTFLANVSHELRTPLNAIVGFSAILGDGEGAAVPTDLVGEYSRHIHQAGMHLTNIVNDILDISALSSQKAKASPREIDVHHEIEIAAKLLDYKAGAQGMEIVMEGCGGERLAQFDPRHFLQIMTNLMDNAIKYSPGTDQIRLSVLEQEGQCKVSVQDFGMGISEDNLSQIFEPFQREQAAINKNIEGTGLGLCLVREMAQANKAEITVTSKQGIGSTFTLEFPMPASAS